MVFLFLLLGCNLSYIVDLFAALHELASASALTLLKLASSVRALLKPYGDTLRRRNTRYKNLQLVGQHCFVASFRRCFPFFTLCDNLSRTKNICCGLKKVVAKSRARVYFEQQILTLLLVFHQIHNLSRNKFARALANQPICAPHFFNLQQMFLLRVKLITQGEKRETSTKTCNETMLRDKLKVFVSRISPPLRRLKRVFSCTRARNLHTQ